MIGISELIELMPPGFTFHPTDEVLINDYLKPKNRGRVSQDCIIPEVDVCKYDPSDLPHIVLGNSVIKTKDQQWFFFCPRNFKFSNSNMSNRATESGYWKITCKDKKIEHRGNVTAIKKTLVFYRGRVPNDVNTEWAIDEYHETGTLPNQRPFDFVLCRLRKKEETKKKAAKKTKATTSDEGEPSSYTNASDVENSVPEHTIPELPINNQQEPSVADFPISNGHSNDHNGMQSQIDNAEENLAWGLLNASLFPCGDINSPIDNQQEPSVADFPISNGHSNDHNGMQSQIDIAEENLAWGLLNASLFPCGDINSPINNQKEPSNVGLPSANACSDDCNGMQSQFGSTEQEEDHTEFFKELFLKLDKYSCEEMMQFISNDSSTLESLGKVDNGDGGISSATHSDTAQAQEYIQPVAEQEEDLFPSVVGKHISSNCYNGDVISPFAFGDGNSSIALGDINSPFALVDENSSMALGDQNSPFAIGDENSSIALGDENSPFALGDAAIWEM